MQILTHCIALWTSAHLGSWAHSLGTQHRFGHGFLCNLFVPPLLHFNSQFCSTFVQLKNQSTFLQAVSDKLGCVTEKQLVPTLHLTSAVGPNSLLGLHACTQTYLDIHTLHWTRNQKKVCYGASDNSGCALCRRAKPTSGPA